MRVILTIGADLAEGKNEVLNNIFEENQGQATAEDVKSLFDGAQDNEILDMEIID